MIEVAVNGVRTRQPLFLGPVWTLRSLTESLAQELQLTPILAVPGTIATVESSSAEMACISRCVRLKQAKPF